MKEIIIFGRSPFINDINVQEFIDDSRFHTVGFNAFGLFYSVDSLFVYDRPVPGHRAKQYFHPHWQRGIGQSIPFQPKAGAPLFKKRYQAPPRRDVIILGFRHFVTSLALNWAILNGFTDIYLMGIDHVEEDGKMSHFDGEEAIVKSSVKAHRDLKEFVYQCASRANIYQCNPAVKDDWALPYKDVSELYG